MSPLRIRKLVLSEPFEVPELAQFVGKAVEIVITEVPTTAEERAKALEAALAAGPIDYDVEAFRAYREFNRLHGQPPEL
jgi:hypothetical protein